MGQSHPSCSTYVLCKTELRTRQGHDVGAEIWWVQWHIHSVTQILLLF